MPLSFAKGDLFRPPRPGGPGARLQLRGAMGKGITTQFRDRHPRMDAEYKQRCADGCFRPDDVFDWKGGTLRLQDSTTWMLFLAEGAGVQHIGLPRTGAGLSGIAWEDIRALL